MKKLLFICAIALGMLVLFFGIKEFIASFHLYRNGIQTTATITEIIRRNSASSRSKPHSPMLSFTLPDGKKVSIVSNGRTSKDAYHIGQKVQISYLPTDPMLASIRDFQSMWRMSLGALALSSIIIGIALTIDIKP